MPDSVVDLHIVIYEKYDYNIIKLPIFLEKLTIWGNYVTDLPEVFPETLVEIVLTNCNYNRSVDNLPNGLQVLLLGTQFNQPINNLPLSLKKLYIKSAHFDQSIDMLPSGLEKLYLWINLKQYEYKFSLDNLPNKLKSLQVQFQSLPSREFAANNLPDSIEYLELDCKHFPNIIKLPANIKRFVHYGCRCSNLARLKTEYKFLDF